MTTPVHSTAYRGWQSFRADLIWFRERLDSILADVKVSGDITAAECEINSLIKDIGIARLKAVALLGRSESREVASTE